MAQVGQCMIVYGGVQQTPGRQLTQAYIANDTLVLQDMWAYDVVAHTWHSISAASGFGQRLVWVCCALFIVRSACVYGITRRSQTHTPFSFVLVSKL